MLLKLLSLWSELSRSKFSLLKKLSASTSHRLALFWLEAIVAFAYDLSYQDELLHVSINFKVQKLLDMLIECPKNQDQKKHSCDISWSTQLKVPASRGLTDISIKW